MDVNSTNLFYYVFDLGSYPFFTSRKDAKIYLSGSPFFLSNRKGGEITQTTQLSLAIFGKYSFFKKSITNCKSKFGGENEPSICNCKRRCY